MVETVVHSATDANQYRDNAVLVTMRLLNAANLLRPSIAEVLDFVEDD
jgi:hypothetical protein